MANVPCVRILALLLLSAWSAVSLKANGTFRLSSDIRQAYDLMLELKLDEAAQLLQGTELNEPDNLLNFYLADYVDFLDIFVHDDQEKYMASKSTREMRLRLVGLGEVSSPYYLFVQAEIYLHRAVLRMRFGENLYAATDINQAFRLLKRNQKRFPDFTPNLKSLGFLRAAFGTLPDSYRTIIELLSSAEGSVEDGMRDLQMALRDKNQLAYRETQYLYILALLHFQNDPGKALEYARSAGLWPEENLIQCFILSHVALKSGQNDLAIKWMEAGHVTEEAPRLPHLQLMYGIAKLQRLDADADAPLKHFLDTYQGKNYRKEAWQKLAWCAMIRGDVPSYLAFLDECQQDGVVILEVDKYAMAEATKRIPPRQDLLKVRLLFDGGYDFEALKILETIDFGILSDHEKVEFRYRAGRIYQRIGREYDALFSYKVAMSEGVRATDYYPCAAALYAGLLYESKGDLILARQYFQMCLEMHPEVYQDGLHQKAKAGMSRINANAN